MNKNCNNCIHLEHYQNDNYESFDSQGYACNNRQYKTEKEEDDHLKKLNNKIYRMTSKKCCRLPKPLNQQPTQKSPAGKS